MHNLDCHPERSEGSLLFALTINSNRKSHTSLVMSPHLASKLISPRGSENEISLPRCTWQDWFKLDQHTFVLFISWEWASIRLIRHNHELVDIVPAI